MAGVQQPMGMLYSRTMLYFYFHLRQHRKNHLPIRSDETILVVVILRLARMSYLFETRWSERETFYRHCTVLFNLIYFMYIYVLYL